MAIIKACNVANKPKNTGKQCDTAMVATAMPIAMQRGSTFSDADLADPVTWLTTLIHARTAFPLFGHQAPIREIKNNKEADQIVTLDDGLQVYLRPGVYNRMFATTSGGLCYAEALQSFLNSGYDIVEVDQQGQMLACVTATPGIYRPLFTDFMYSPAPELADFKTTPYKNFFSYSFNPLEMVQNGIIFTGASALLSLQGLIDAQITKAAPATVTKLKIGVQTTCSQDDLVARFGNALGTHINNFRVEDVAALGTPGGTLTAAAIVTGWIELTGTFVTAHTYRVWGATPAAWLANNVNGYDASANYVDILIP